MSLIPTRPCRTRRWPYLLVLWASVTAAAEPSGMIDRVVASVDGRVITLSELEFEARVALIERGGLAAASAPLDDETLASALELSIGRRLEAAEADKLQAHPVEDAEVTQAVGAFKARFGSERELQLFLARHEMDVQGLAAVLARGLRADKVLDAKLRLRSQVGEAEVRRYYDSHRDELGQSYTDIRGALREKLTRERFQKLLQAELAEIRRGADVRLVAPFSRGLRR